MPRPVIALLTDFGTRDHYAASMKGVILGICPGAVLVDVTHDIQPHDILGGALELAAAAQYFPAGTIFVAVVDPGVGTARRAIAAEAGGRLFVAPDNGVLTGIFEAAPPALLVEITEPRYVRPSVSRTFEGRDRFAPVAAWLGAGVALTALGPSIDDWHRLLVPEPEASANRIDGQVLRIDRFGNLVTNIDRSLFDRRLGVRDIKVSAGAEDVRLVGTYADAPAGGLCALFGSTGHLEIAVNGGSAAERLALRRGAPITVAPAIGS